eukprot:TRINITY_DN580_c0_g1_i2.p1 TRINITY_DN580_c0_g1~~TRINITY_DN580_c0_g1_i2.p1  ORF type:complete len:717 (-),score=122.24 TRINITY_DN580_c0_g1_i2:679-2829(-)
MDKATSLLLLVSVLLIGRLSAQDGIVSKEYSLGHASVLNMEWIGADKQVVVIHDTNGKLHRSSDEGRTFHPVTTITSRVRFIESSSFDNLVLFVACEGNKNYLSTDGGAKFQSVKLDATFERVQFHPSSRDLVLGAVRSKECPSNDGCNRELHVSKDSGMSWALLDTYVEEYTWSPFPEHTHGITFALDTIFWTAHGGKTGKQRFAALSTDVHLYVSRNLSPPSQVLKSANRVRISDRFIFVTVYAPNTEFKLQLYVSYDGVNFIENKFAEPVDDSGFEIPDASTGAAFIAAHHAGNSIKEAQMYKTDSRGTRPTSSLNRVYRNVFGDVDFEKVPSMEGVYVANQVDLIQEGELKTSITFDNGGRWSSLKAPAFDHEGKPIKCGVGCGLHLHGSIDADRGFSPLYSVENAVGLVIASGNVGPYLYQHHDLTNTYLSRDGGLSWVQITNGSYIYEFGDHGALLVIAPNDKLTDSIKYSWNEGMSWKTYKFASSPIDVDNVIIEPLATSQRFIVYGSRPGSTFEGVVISIDFQGLHEQECEGEDAPDTEQSDYETWTPAYPNGSPCVMGRQTTYTRRKRDRECYNGKEYERKEFHRNCPCSTLDYECDYGYYREVEEGPCVRHPETPQELSIDEQCTYASTYTVSTGHRRIVGNTCEGGLELDPKTFSCEVEQPFLTSRGWAIVGALLLAIVATVSVVMYRQNACVFFSWNSPIDFHD